MVDNDTRDNRVTYFHPDLSKVGPMTGRVEFDAYEKEDLFFPDEVFHDGLYDAYGVEGAAGLYLKDATISVIEA